MAHYSEQIQQHLARPRNPGALPNPTAVGRAENSACGDVLDLYVTLEDGRITRTGFQAAGCPPAIAVGSLLTELLIGLSPQQALAITTDQLEEVLGGIPSAKRHVLTLAREAVRQALQSVRN